MPKDYAETGMERLRSALKGSFTPGSREWYADQIYGTGVPADVEQKRAESADFIASMTPGIGEGMALRDAWKASGRGGQALMQGDVGDAAGEYMNLLSSLAGGLLPFSVQKLTSAAMPSDPSSTTMIFAGPTAKTADHAALAKAQEMKAQGASRDDIWRDTGWGQDPADNWLFEIDDSGATFRKNYLKGAEEGKPLGAFLNHAPFYRAYPEARQWSVETIPPNDTRGAWYPESRIMTLSDELSPEDMRTVVPHELQHGVDDIEGWPAGIGTSELTVANADPSEPYFRYLRSMDETRARNVQSRMNMNAAERRAKPPWETQDVPDDQQIVRFGNQGPAYSASSGDIYGTISKNNQIGDYRLTGPSSDDTYEIIRSDGKRVGDINIGQMDDGSVYLGPRIDPEFQKQGIASEIYKHVQGLADQSGLKLKKSNLQTPAGDALWRSLERR